MNKKIILITGATDGIGKASAIALAQQGHHIIIHGRNQTKAEQVVEEIKAATHNSQVDYVLADLLSLASVTQLAAPIKANYPHLTENRSSLQLD